MHVLTAIGEQLVTVGLKSVKFRPSFLNMSRIGSPTDIVAAFATVCGVPRFTGNPVLDTPLLRRWRSDQFRTAGSVLWCCTDEDDISWLVGYINERGRYVAGVLPLEDIVGLAHGLLRHGVVGDAPPEHTRSAKKSDYTSQFNARDFVAAAMAHLGTSEKDAWEMTMSGYIGAMRAKFPPTKEQTAPPTTEDVVRVEDWLSRVNKARAAQKAANHV